LDALPECRPTAAEAMEHAWLRRHVTNNPSFAKALQLDERIDSQVSTSADVHETVDSQNLTPHKASERSFESLCVEYRQTERDESGIGCDNERVMSGPLCPREMTMSAFFNGPEPEKETTTDEAVDDNNEEDDGDVEPCPDMPILRSLTPVWADVQRTLSSLRLRGMSPRQTLESYRKSRNSWNDGRVTGQSRVTGRLTRELFDMERTSYFFTKEEVAGRDTDGRERKRSFEDEAPGILRELAESDVRKKSENKSAENCPSATDDTGVMANSTWQQDVLTELKTDTGVAENHKGNCVVARRRSASKQLSEDPMEDSCPSGNASSAVRSLRQKSKAIEARDVDLMSESCCEVLQPASGANDNRYCRIRSLRGRNPVNCLELADLTDLNGGSEAQSTAASSRRGPHDQSTAVGSRRDSKGSKPQPPLTPVAPSTPSDGPEGKGNSRPARQFSNSISSAEDDRKKKDEDIDIGEAKEGKTEDDEALTEKTPCCLSSTQCSNNDDEEK